MAIINGTENRDVVMGTDDDDVITGFGGDDYLKGEGGDDELIGGAGNDNLNGGTGNDTLLGGADRDVLTGAEGDDLLIGGEGSDVHWGGDGHDTAVFDQAFANVTITTNVSTLTVHGAGGDDTVLGDVEVLEFAGISYSFDQVWQSGTPVLKEKHGTWWDEWINGGDLNERINGDGGNDVVRGFGGNDLLLGEQGDDTLAGGAGNDTLTGGEGTDVFSIRAGKWNEGADLITDFTRGLDRIDIQIGDLLQQEPGLMALSGQADSLELSDLDASAEWTIGTSDDGDVKISHDSGSMELDGIAFGDAWDSFADLADVLTLDGEDIPVGSAAEPDVPPAGIIGHDWDEWLKGTEEADRLDGAGGNDVVRGYGGDDEIAGGTGEDTLRGEAGNDTLTGGEGADTFSIRAGKWGEGDDVIADFDPAADRIDLALADLLNATPDLAALTGDAGVIEISDFEAAAGWTIGASGTGSVLIVHPTGSIELAGIAFGESTDSFADLAPFITIDGEAIPGAAAPPAGDHDCGDTGPIPIDQGGVIYGTDLDDCIAGSDGQDYLLGFAGDDHLRGYGGNDTLDGGDGNDTLQGGVGGLNSLLGGEGADIFKIQAGAQDETENWIFDLERGVDTLVMDAGEIAEFDPGLAGLAGDPDRLDLADLEASADWSINPYGTGDGDPRTIIIHPGGSVVFDNLVWGPETDSFTDLADIIAFIGQPEEPVDHGPEPVTGHDWAEWLKGTDDADHLDGADGDDVVRGYGGDDTLIGGQGDDTLRGEAGNDVLTGGEGADSFRIRSGKWGQGDDVVTDFELGTDKLVFVGADMLKADPGLAALAGDDGLLELDDLDVSGQFGLSASDDGDLLVSHQSGTVELNGIAFGDATDSFAELASIVEIEIA